MSFFHIMQRPLLLAMILLLALPAREARASESVPVFKPSEIGSAVHAMAPYGSGTYTYLTLTIYDATLWTDTDPFTMTSPFAIAMRYDLDVDVKEFTDGSIDEMNKEKSLTQEETQTFRALMFSLLQPIHKGDRMTLLMLPGKALRLFYNGRLSGQTTNMAFAERFVDMWISPQASDQDLREELLKLN